MEMLHEFVIKRGENGLMEDILDLGTSRALNPFDEYEAAIIDHSLKHYEESGWNEIFSLLLWDGRLCRCKLSNQIIANINSDLEMCSHAYCIGTIAGILNERNER